MVSSKRKGELNDENHLSVAYFVGNFGLFFLIVLFVTDLFGSNVYKIVNCFRFQNQENCKFVSN